MEQTSAQIHQPEIPMRLRLLKLTQNLPLYLSKDNQPYISCPTATPLYSEDFFTWMFHQSSKRLAYYPSQYEFCWVVRTLDRQARQAKNKQPIFTRIAKLSPKSYQLDLTNEDHQVINITGKNWHQSRYFKTQFERIEDHLPLPFPQPTKLTLDGCFQQIFRTSPEASEKLAIWLAEAILPNQKPPILVITGKAREQAVEMLRNLIDPVNCPIINTPCCPIELNRMALENRVLAFSVWDQPTEKLTRKLNTIHQGTRVPLMHSNKRKPKLYTTVDRPILIAAKEPISINKNQISIEINEAPDTEIGKVFHALLDLIVKIVGQPVAKPKYLMQSAAAAPQINNANPPQTIDTS